jgi:hypothetical protein
MFIFIIPGISKLNIIKFLLFREYPIC